MRGGDVRECEREGRAVRGRKGRAGRGRARKETARGVSAGGGQDHYSLISIDFRVMTTH